MTNEISDLIKRLNDPLVKTLDIIHWASPIPAFGNPLISKIATLGLNPSDKEFIDDNRQELVDNKRRFQTLTSLGISSWNNVGKDKIQLLADQCNDYFIRKPYDSWFKRLDFLISGTSMSYYFPSREACHLDLVPHATSVKWGSLSTTQKSKLLNKYGDVLGAIIKNSSIKTLVLNGKTVIDSLAKISDVNLIMEAQPSWNLPRKNSHDVKGFSYVGRITQIGGIRLAKEILILGYNHNIQSSFGVTSLVQQEIRRWISEQVKNTYEST